jgi:hypothetical protein
MRRFGRVELLGSWTLCSKAEQFVDELELVLDIMARQPTDLPLPHPVYRLIAVDRSACRAERAESLFGVHALLDIAVVLFNDVVEVLHRPGPAATANHPAARQLGNGCRIGGRPVRVDHARLPVSPLTERPAEETLGGMQIAKSRQGRTQ